MTYTTRMVSIRVPEVSTQGSAFTPSQMYNAIMALIPYTGLDTARWTPDEFREYWDEVNQIIQDNIDQYADDEEGYEQLECVSPSCEACGCHINNECHYGEEE